MRGRPPKSSRVPSRKIWVDADTCPAPIMDVLLRTADSHRMILTLVASRSLQSHQSAYIRTLVLPGPDAVTGKIAAMLDSGDVVVTSDGPLARAAASKSATSLDPRNGAEGSKASAAANDPVIFSRQLNQMIARTPAPAAA